MSVIEVVRSISGRTIRLTSKQWFHIVDAHDYMAGNIDKILETINTPDYIVKGDKAELIALRHYSKTNITEKHCVVVYKENGDGFVITAFFTSKPKTIIKQGVVWSK